MKTARQNILVSGIPGSGKTTYCRWLEKEKGFLHLDFDELQNRRGTARKLLLYDHLRLTAEDFLRAISKKRRPVVIDWGFPPAMISLVRLLQMNGFAVWWFDGDRDAAKKSFLQRDTVSLDAFTAQMQSIEEDWQFIEEVVGQNRIDTVGAGPSYRMREFIYKTMFSR